MLTLEMAFSTSLKAPLDYFCASAAAFALREIVVNRQNKTRQINNNLQLGFGIIP